MNINSSKVLSLHLLESSLSVLMGCHFSNHDTFTREIHPSDPRPEDLSQKWTGTHIHTLAPGSVSCHTSRTHSTRFRVSKTVLSVPGSSDPHVSSCSWTLSRSGPTLGRGHGGYVYVLSGGRSKRHEEWENNLYREIGGKTYLVLGRPFSSVEVESCSLFMSIIKVRWNSYTTPCVQEPLRGTFLL